MRHIILVCFSVSFALFATLVGCECGEINPTGDAAITDAIKDQCIISCTNDSQCGCKQFPYCVAGTCSASKEAVPEKTAEKAPDSACSTPCKDGYTCDNGTCVKIDCAANADCTTGYVCVAGKCQKENTCQNDGDCASGETCDNGTCKKAQSCTSDADCASGETCKSGTCAKNTGVSCTKDADCSNGETCQSGKCKIDPNAECKIDSDCGNVKLRHCYKGKCLYRSDGCNDGRPQCEFRCPASDCWLECWKAGNGGEIKNSQMGNLNKWREWPKDAKYCFKFLNEQPICHANKKYLNHEDFVNGKAEHQIDCGKGAIYSWRQSSQGEGKAKVCNESGDLANASWQTICQ